MVLWGLLRYHQLTPILQRSPNQKGSDSRCIYDVIPKVVDFHRALSLSLSEESPGSRWDSHLHLPSLTRQPALAGASTHVTQSILRRFHGTSVHLKLGALGEHGEKAGEGRSGAALLRWMESCRLFCEVPSSFPLPLKLHELVIA